MVFFWILWSIDALVASVFLLFFFIGLNDGTVSSFNAGIWFIVLLILAIVVGGSLYLKSNDYINLAKSLLIVLAIPSVLYGLLILVSVITGARWN